jgi:cyclic pyranopterin phosphate synthase
METFQPPAFGKEQNMTQLTDGFGRRFPYLRLSIIDACNFRCGYCLPNGYHAPKNRPSPLSVPEIQRLLQAFAGVGMRKLRITGGEPTLRKDLLEIIRTARAVSGIEKIAMTSNGCLLNTQGKDWLNAGVSHLNISIDSLDADLFHRITGHNRLPDILQGIENLLDDGFLNLKINAVLLRDVNNAQLPLWLDYIRERPVSIRFIELMQTGAQTEYFKMHHVRAEGLEKQLCESGWQLQNQQADAGPAREYVHEKYRGRIGVIAPYSDDFCTGCNRLRVTSMGDLRLCLFGETGITLRQLLHADSQQAELQALLVRQLRLKTIGHRLHFGVTGLTPHLASIGG